MTTITIEDAFKPLFDQWLEEALPSIEEKILNRVAEDTEIKSKQVLFSQKEMAKRQNVSVTTFKKWRVLGLQAEPSPTGKLLFDINKVDSWREEHNCRKEN